ncbi:porin [Roseicitreum antarcticum]|uniref:Outer membrane protein OmpU n=1 Tax=Roseicitreum antarcticum TaxID=564137 RepID=A0A1H3AKR0_9RHOB|nr:porin [Roseicitreum antarcticum]SDX30267.1 outer membrane protein OmpU [Roseicitreum antarcticum]
MKNILLASTALVLSAGVAAADVTVGGSGRMGVTYDNSAVDKMAFTSRIRISFSGSGETDGGLQFGGSIRADNAPAGNAGTGGSVFIAGDFGRITMGDTSGAAEYIVGDLHGVGLTGIGDLNENAYLSNGGAVARSAMRYQYTLDGLKLALSIDNPGGGNEVYSIGAGYEFDGFGIGIGHERNNVASANHTIGYVSYSLSNVDLKATYGDATGAVSAQYGLSASATFDAVGVSAFVRRDFTDLTHYGIGGSYDLGGGAALKGGIVRQELAVGDATRADFGIAFDF